MLRRDPSFGKLKYQSGSKETPFKPWNALALKKAREKKAVATGHENEKQDSGVSHDTKDVHKVGNLQKAYSNEINMSLQENKDVYKRKSRQENQSNEKVINMNDRGNVYGTGSLQAAQSNTKDRGLQGNGRVYGTEGVQKSQINRKNEGAQINEWSSGLQESKDSEWNKVQCEIQTSEWRKDLNEAQINEWNKKLQDSKDKPWDTGLQDNKGIHHQCQEMSHPISQETYKQPLIHSLVIDPTPVYEDKNTIVYNVTCDRPKKSSSEIVKMVSSGDKLGQNKFQQDITTKCPVRENDFFNKVFTASNTGKCTGDKHVSSEGVIPQNGVPMNTPSNEDIQDTLSEFSDLPTPVVSQDVGSLSGKENIYKELLASFFDPMITPSSNEREYDSTENVRNTLNNNHPGLHDSENVMDSQHVNEYLSPQNNAPRTPQDNEMVLEECIFYEIKDQNNKSFILNNFLCLIPENPQKKGNPEISQDSQNGTKNMGCQPERIQYTVDELRKYKSNKYDGIGIEAAELMKR
ncbi:hypothetical protein BDF14DRAFT_1994271 [Spinellus fusiger]|nr:hypothetical protein BDF14DRAFT_1994271 [Spinellus fusiger]